MTTFAEMVTLVNEITKRPELVATTNLAIKLATLRAHSIEFFHRDQANAQLDYSVSLSSPFQDIASIYSVVPLMRTPNFLQSEDPATFQPVENLEFEEDYKRLYDQDNALRQSVFTFLGETLRAVFQAPTGRARLYYYKNPDTSISGYSSWIANSHPEELAMWAAAIVWNRSGNIEQAKLTQDTHIAMFKDLLITSYLFSKV